MPRLRGLVPGKADHGLYHLLLFESCPDFDDNPFPKLSHVSFLALRSFQPSSRTLHHLPCPLSTSPFPSSPLHLSIPLFSPIPTALPLPSFTPSTSASFAFLLSPPNLLLHCTSTLLSNPLPSPHPTPAPPITPTTSNPSPPPPPTPHHTSQLTSPRPPPRRTHRPLHQLPNLGHHEERRPRVRGDFDGV